VIDASHTFLVRNSEAITQTLHFLKDGAFARAAAAQPDS
jgi:hypothetical protein